MLYKTNERRTKMITNEMLQEWLLAYQELDSNYRSYLQLSDEAPDYESADRWDRNASQIRYRMRGMITCLNIFGYEYDGTEIFKISDDVIMTE